MVVSLRYPQDVALHSTRRSTHSVRIETSCMVGDMQLQGVRPPSVCTHCGTVPSGKSCGIRHASSTAGACHNCRRHKGPTEVRMLTSRGVRKYQCLTPRARYSHPAPWRWNATEEFSLAALNTAKLTAEPHWPYCRCCNDRSSPIALCCRIAFWICPS